MTRSDSVASQHANFTGADIEAPAHIHLREGDIPFWSAIVRARARETWTDVDLNHAANLARCQADIERIQGELDEEGDTLTNDRGTVVLNPKHQLLETLSRRSIALARTLQVHAMATVGESKQSKNKNTKQRDADNAIRNADDGDDLIPRATH